MKNHRIQGLRKRMGYQNGYDVSPIGSAGGLSFWSHQSLHVDVIFSLQNVINACTDSRGRLTVVGEGNFGLWHAI